MDPTGALLQLAEASGMSKDFHTLSIWARDRPPLPRAPSKRMCETLHHLCSVFPLYSSVTDLFCCLTVFFFPTSVSHRLKCHLRLTKCTKYLMNIWLIWFIQMNLSLAVSTHCFPALSCSSAWFAAIYYTSGGLTVSFYGLLLFRHASV